MGTFRPFISRQPPCHTLGGALIFMKYHSPSLQEISSCHDSEEPATTAGHSGELRVNCAKHYVDPTLIFKSWPARFLLQCLFQSREAESL